jgi:hypothetical protein
VGEGRRDLHSLYIEGRKNLSSAFQNDEDMSCDADDGWRYLDTAEVWRSSRHGPAGSGTIPSLIEGLDSGTTIPSFPEGRNPRPLQGLSL